jgi:chromosome partitioning protein
MAMRVVPVIAPTNYKGGVGKTTSGRVLGQEFALMPEVNKGKPVLFIDLDPQANTSKRWKLMRVLPSGDCVPVPHPGIDNGENSGSSICDLWLDLLKNKDGTPVGSAMHPVPYATSNPLIHVVPANELLMAKAMRLDEDPAKKLGSRLRAWLRDPEIADQYCCVIIDTQPSKTNLIDAALKAATHAYIPFNPEPQAVEGLYSMVSYLALQERSGDIPLKILGLLPNEVRKNVRLHTKHLKLLADDPVFKKYLMPVKLFDRIQYAESDDWRNSPETVSSVDGADITVEVQKFARFVAKKLTEGGFL